MFLWVVLVCTALVCAHALLWLRGRRARALLAGLPTYPINLPFFGNVYQVFGLTGNSERLFTVITKLSKIIEKKKRPFALWIGPCPVVVVSDPEDVKAVTNAYIEKPYYYSLGRDLAGNGLVIAPGAVWKHNIKNLSGSFSGHIVDGYQEVFNRLAADLVDKLRGEAEGAFFDVQEKYLTYTSLEAICQVAMYVPKESERIVAKEYYKAFNRAFELIIQRFMNVFYHPDCVYHLTSAYKELLSCVAVIHNVSDTVINKKRIEREEMKKNGTWHDRVPENGTARYKSFLDTLLDLSEVDPKMTHQQMGCEVNNIIMAGQETIATTMFLALQTIGSRTDVQEKLYTEMKEIFGDSKRAVQKEDLSQMAYCEALLYEVLRMYPPVPVFMRDADQDLQLKSCTIPKGTVCTINAWGAGRSKRAWGPDADQFRPERWLEYSRCPEYLQSFLAFSYGRRACIGKRYAMAILKTLLAHCVRELVFVSEAEKMRFELNVTLKAISGHRIKVRLRETSTR